tara:strand:- start:336 stop:998 length:663 start_codon:yes stop_codon:yes gene_type:complete
MIKNIVIMINLTFLLSCSSFPLNNIAPGYLETFKSIKNAVLGFEDSFITRELVNNIPYASKTLKIGKGPKGLMILESINKDEMIWISADPIYLVTKNGRIIKTEGLENDLKGVIYPRISFEEILEKPTNLLTSYYSYDNPELNNLELKIRYFVQAKEEVFILNTKYDLTLVEEVVSNDKLGWNFKNLYWLDENFYVWKSQQTINPKIPEFTIEVTKKPSF